MQLTWTDLALADLQSVREFIEIDNPAAARAVVERILDAVELLDGFPKSGRPGRVAGTRELVIPDLPYIVAYCLREDSIELLRVLHGARRWPSRF